MRREDLRAIEGMTDAQIDAVMALHGQDEAAHRTQVNGLQQQLSTAQQGLKAFEGVDVNDLRTQISTLQQRLDAQAAEYTFNGVLSNAARTAGALSEEDVIALLPGKDALRSSKNQSEDVKAAMDQLKTAKPYLFNAAPAAAEADPEEADDSDPIVIPKPRPKAGSSTPNISDFINMTGAERMALRTKNPALYQQLANAVRAARR